MLRKLALLAALFMVLPGSSRADAPEPFLSFLRTLKTAPATSYVSRTATAVKTAADFEQMRRHLLGLYEGVHVRRSFIWREDTFDCVPVFEQPAARTLKITRLAEPPPASAL